MDCCRLDSSWHSSRRCLICSTSKIDERLPRTFLQVSSFSDKFNSTVSTTWHGASNQKKFLLKLENYLDQKLDFRSWTMRWSRLQVDVDVATIFYSLQNFSLAQFGVNSGRGSIISCGSVGPSQGVSTIGVFKGERVAIKKISKKKVIRKSSDCISFFH